MSTSAPIPISIPIVDLDGPLERQVSEIDAACRTIGFFAIVNHGVPAEIADAAWADATAFFDRPLDEKMAVAFPEPGYPYGYSPVAYETLAASLGAGGLPDLKESLAVGPDCLGPAPVRIAHPDERWIRSPSRWPARPATLQDSWTQYFRTMSDLSARLLGVMAMALRLAPDHFEPLIDRHTSAMRALRYPALATAPAPGQLRAGAHTDYGTLTILRTDAVSGLQIRVGDRWLDVPPVPAGFVVNLGDSMAQWTNDRWRSTLHRVVAPASTDGAPARQSFAFFHMANWDAVIECLPTCLVPGEVPRHAPVLAGPWLMDKFTSTVAATPSSPS